MTDARGGPNGSFDWGALKRRTAASVETELDDRQLERLFAERAAALAQGLADTREHVGAASFAFVHAGIRLAVDMGCVLRILRSRRLTRVPGAPEHLRQIFYEAGRIVSVVDVSLLLGRSPCPAGDDRVVLLEQRGRWLGVCTQKVIGPVRFELSKLGAPSPNLDARIARCVRGVADDMTVVVDGSALVEAVGD